MPNSRAPRPETDDPILRSLRGKKLVFTGRLWSGTRKEAHRFARRAGAVPVKSVSRRTDVLVQGEPTYRVGSIGVKLETVERLRREGHLIYVITEPEFDRLRRGRPLTLEESFAAVRGGTAVFGIPWRPRPKLEKEPKNLKVIMEYDLDVIERRSRAHEALVTKVERAIRRRRLQPIFGHQSCAYDVGWEAGGTVHVVEVKTTTRKNQTQQIRLGLGQVLDYEAGLRENGAKRVRTHLVLSNEPTSGSLRRACEQARVVVSWSADLSALFEI